MPTYDYFCKHCGKNNITRLVKMSERNDQACECGEQLSRSISLCQAPVFKGVKATCSMNTAQRLPDVDLTTDAR